jgi:hypothetical protein
MKFASTYDRGAGLLTLASSENCDTDAWPLVPQVFFRHYQGVLDPDLGAVAAAVLFASHCGSVAEFHGAKVGIDVARTIRTVAPDIEDVLPMDGKKREIGQGSSSIVVGAIDRILDGGVDRGAIGKAARVVTWSGDFVPTGERNSSRHIGGDIFTNALLVAKGTSISVAIALLVAGRGLRDIFVPKPPKDEAEEFARIADGLEFVSIKLKAI